MNDLLSECMSDLKTTDTAAFTETFCQRCRQQGCARAKWSGDKFGARVANQVDRLLHPDRADPKSSRYEYIPDFKDMFTEAMRLEISDRRGDWNVPVIPDFDKMHMPKHMIYSEPVIDPEVPVDGLADPTSAEDTTVSLPPRRAPEGVPATVVPAPKVGAAQVRMGNTSVPAGGLVLGGSVSRPSKPVHDPWAAPIPVKGIVKPGATIRMGGDE